MANVAIKKIYRLPNYKGFDFKYERIAKEWRLSFFNNNILIGTVLLNESIFFYTNKNIIILKSKSKKYFTKIDTKLTNLIEDLTIGFQVDLDLIGPGLRFLKLEDGYLVFDLAYSHLIRLVMPNLMKIFKLNNEGTKIRLIGLNREKVLNLGQQICFWRLLSPYTGAGVKFTVEYFKKKERKHED